jgi:dienelactone hydrolase
LASVFLASSTFPVPTIWGNLEPGPHAVGFKTIEYYDYSRTYAPEKDYFGNPLGTETARPVQICYWYPAEVGPNEASMVYAEYSFPYPENGGFIDVLGALQNRDLQMLFFYTNNSQAAVQGVMDTDMHAVRDAVEKPGPFPLVIYHGPNGGGFCGNAVLCEYLASHGFVVATTHTMGALAAAAGQDQSDIESVVRDREIIWDELHGLTSVDADRVGLVGYAYGGSTAIAHAMRHTDIDALVTVVGAFLLDGGADAVREHAFYVPEQLQVPWMQVYAEDEQFPVDLSLLDSLRYADRYDAKMANMSVQDPYTYRLLAATLTPDSGVTFADAARGHHTICALTLDFLNAQLASSEGSADWSETRPEFAGIEWTVTEAAPVPPTAIQFQNIVQNYGAVRAKEVSDQFDLTNPENPILPGQTFTNLGYGALQRQRNVTDALILFEMGVTAYPTAANAWDSYGEACVANGDLELGLANYRRALELVPGDSTLTPAFRQLLETNIPGVIEGLEQQIAEQAAGDGAGEGGE